MREVKEREVSFSHTKTRERGREGKEIERERWFVWEDFLETNSNEKFKPEAKRRSSVHTRWMREVEGERERESENFF